jgi:hypothetical protein
MWQLLIDSPGAFMQADMEGVADMKLEGKMTELVVRIDPKLYRKYVQIERRHEHNQMVSRCLISGPSRYKKSHRWFNDTRKRNNLRNIYASKNKNEELDQTRVSWCE